MARLKFDNDLTISIAIIFVALCFFAWPIGILFGVGVLIGLYRFPFKNILMVSISLILTILLSVGSVESNKGSQGLAFHILIIVSVFLGILGWLLVSSALGAHSIKSSRTLP